METPTRTHRAALVALLAASSIVFAGTPAHALSVPTTSDRFGTAAAVALDLYPDGADVAILASGENYADALAAAPLADAYGAPILLTRSTTLPEVTAAALEALSVSDVIIMGGPYAVSTSVHNALELDYQVSRVAGVDRYGTAAAVAGAVFDDGADVAVLVSGENFADALAAAPLAWGYDAPILLTGSTTLPAATEAALEGLEVADVIVVGGSAAVSTDISNALESDYQVSRIAGADRFETAAMVAAEAFPDGTDIAVLVSGEGFADALAAGPLANGYYAPILLTRQGMLPEATATALADAEVADVLIVGGPAAVGFDVSNALEIDYQVTRIAGG
ncbi:cell wall-binding repeat-containing protein [Planctomonas psychrotolerans]|uniref:cell wall-binding repeat-containing protein n=1 Tax=Planctomonas psychrotolerans TaxID=2528712 RepID=UPI00123916C0|nr:cell wall-binding repeat-containing protein [Planctomonas psychrotolerans]